MKQNTIKNGNQNVLTPSQEMMRSDVIELELKARYWKATFEAMDYSLKAEEIRERYNIYTETKRKETEVFLAEQQKKMQNAVEKIQPAVEAATETLIQE